MTYLSYVWKILSSSSDMIAITLGNMLMFFFFFRPRLKWWLYPTLVAMTYLALPYVNKLRGAVPFKDFCFFSIII